MADTTVRADSAHANSAIEALHVPFGHGIEHDACVLEIRLALAEYRERHGPNHWRLFLRPSGRA